MDVKGHEIRPIKYSVPNCTQRASFRTLGSFQEAPSEVENALNPHDSHISTLEKYENVCDMV